jgi:hypothetical protein
MPFKKGKSGNDAKKFSSTNQPAHCGRPKGKSLTTILKEMLECEAPESVTNNEYIQQYIKRYSKSKKLTHKQAVMLKMMHSAEALGDMKAIVEILDRTEGKVTQPIEGNGIIKITIGKK